MPGPPRRWRTIAAASAIALSSNLHSLERKPVVFELPPGVREAPVKGSLSFPPASVLSTDNVRLVDRDGREVPRACLQKSLWFDGSVMLVEVRFKGNRAQERSLWVEWGKEVKSARRLLNVKGNGKSVDFRLFEGAGDIRVQKPVEVGTLVVRVEKHADIYYYWYLVPLAVILGWLSLRKHRLRRK